MSTDRHRRILAFALGWSALLTLPLTGPSTAADSTASEQVARGHLLYRIHCASCHGTAGRGDGPVAPALKTAPADLTRIALRQDGDFSDEEVGRTIDGRDAIRSHGSRQMPVWGITFQDSGRDNDQEVEVEAKIEALVAFLRSIQEGPGKGE